jgi:arylsulfatase
VQLPLGSLLDRYGPKTIVRSEVIVPEAGAHRPGVRVHRLTHVENPTPQTGPGTSEITLLIDGALVGRIETKFNLPNFISWSGLDIGRDRGSPVSHYEAPFTFTGRLFRVEVIMDVDQRLDGDGIGAAIMARE